MRSSRWKNLATMIIIMGALFADVYAQETYDLESSKVRSKPSKITLDGSAEEVMDVMEAMLLGMEIPAERIENGQAIRINQAWFAGEGREIGEYFVYDKKGEDATFWNFDRESLDAGRTGHLATYIRMGGLVGGMAKKMPNPNAPSATENADIAFLVGRIDIKPAGRAKTNVFIEVLYYIPGTKTAFKPAKSTGKLEKEWIKLTESLLALESRVINGTPEKVKTVLSNLIARYDLSVESDLKNGFMTNRVFLDRRGDHTIDEYAQLRKQLAALWLGTYRAAFLMKPEGDAQTRVKPVFVFMVINGNNGKRKWDVRPSKGFLEEEIFTDLRELMME